MKRERVLFLTTIFPYPLDGGGKIRAFNNIKALNEKYIVDLIAFSEDEIHDEYLDMMKSYCENVYIIKKIFSNSRSKKNVVKNVISSIINNSPFIIEKFKDREYTEYLNILLKKYEYKAVFFEHLSISIYAKYINPNIKLILSQQNYESGLMKRRYYEEHNLIKKLYIFYELKKLIRYERDICSNFNNVIMLSNNDKESLIKDGYIKDNINVIPIGVDNNIFEKSKFNDKVLNILFTGTMTWYPNESGILWFIKNVWNKLRDKLPEVNLYVVGKNPCEELKKYNNINGITVTGYVDDINEYINLCDICIIPLFIGGGMRVKILESMAKGIPCVSTTVGVEGIEAVDKESILIANNEKEFINAICLLNSNRELYNNIIYNAKNLINNKYSTDVINNRIQEIVE